VEKRQALWAQALQETSPQDGLNLTAHLQRRAGTQNEEEKASLVPLWEQLATQVRSFDPQALRHGAKPFNVQFVGEEDVTDSSIRRCPRCGRLLQKSEGCDSMACCIYGSDGCRGERCNHGGGCGHRFDWNETLVLGPFQEALAAFSADLMSSSSVVCDCPNRRVRDGSNQDTMLLRPQLPSLDHDRWPQLLEGAGRLMGVAMRTSLPLRLNLNPLVWRWLCSGSLALGLDDLAEADQQTAHVVRNLRGLASEEEFASLGGEFAFEGEDFAGEVITLGEQGQHARCLADAHELADCLQRWHLHNDLRPLEHVAKGLADVVPLGRLRLLLSAQEVEDAICGAGDVDLARLRQHTEFVSEDAAPTVPEDADNGAGETAATIGSPPGGAASSSVSSPTGAADMPHSNAGITEKQQLDRLFEALGGFGPAERRGFVRLVTGCRRLPEHGDWRLRVRLDRPESEGGSSLPTARACGMLLTLPPCTDAKDFTERLRVAIASTDMPLPEGEANL